MSSIEAPPRKTPSESKWPNRARTAAKIVGLGGAAAIAGVSGITVEHHRKLTHRSIEPHPLYSALVRAEQSTLGVGDTSTWASVHRIHHQMTDATLFPFYKIAGAIEWAERPENQGKVDVPRTFKHLDPFVKEFSREEVTQIGTLAQEHIQNRLGDAYERRTDYTATEVRAMLNPTEPQYHYPDYDNKTQWTQDDIAQVLLTDPHSPALVKGLNGVHGIALKNVSLYGHAANMFRRNPEVKPEDLQNLPERSGGKLEFAAGFALPAAAVLFARGDYSPKGVAKAAAMGAAINGIRIASELAGGNVTNSMGHAGVLDRSRIGRAALRRTYRMELNPDGSLATDTVHAGVIGRLLSWATFDEVGGQNEHHAHPEKIAYTSKTGFEAVKEAPWGSLLSFLVKSKFPLFNEGEDFEETPRPDVPHAGVLLIQEARVRQMQPV